MKAMPQLAASEEAGGCDESGESDLSLKDLLFKRFGRFTRCPPRESLATHTGMPKLPEMGQSLPAYSLQVGKHQKVILFTKS
jgi:hypothetical protein